MHWMSTTLKQCIAKWIDFPLLLTMEKWVMGSNGRLQRAKAAPHFSPALVPHSEVRMLSKVMEYYTNWVNKEQIESYYSTNPSSNQSTNQPSFFLNYIQHKKEINILQQHALLIFEILSNITQKIERDYATRELIIIEIASAIHGMICIIIF